MIDRKFLTAALCLVVPTLSGQPWLQYQLLSDPGMDPMSLFGEEVALVGDTLVVSAPGGSGSVYLFARHSGGVDQWELVQQLLPGPDQTLGIPGQGSFGDGMAYNGRDLFIGSENGTWQYLRDYAGNFVRVATVEAGILAPHVASLAVEGGLLVRGGRGQLGNIGGSVAVHRRVGPSGTEWELGAVRAYIKPMQLLGSCFAEQVLVRNGRIAVADPCRLWLGSPGMTSVSILEWMDDMDSLALRMDFGNQAISGHHFGRGIAFDGDTLLAGVLSPSLTWGRVLAIAPQGDTTYVYLRSYEGIVFPGGNIDVSHGLHVDGPVIMNGVPHGLAFMEKYNGPSGLHYGPDDPVDINDAWVLLRVDTLPGPVSRMSRSGPWLAGGMPSASALVLYHDPILSVAEQPGMNRLNVYPLPAREHVTLAWSGPTIRSGTIRIHDAMGRLVSALPVPAGATTVVMDRKGLAPGTYLAMLVNGRGRPVARARLLWQ